MQIAITVDFKGRWQFPLDKAESLLAGLQSKEAMADCLTGVQQVCDLPAFLTAHVQTPGCQGPTCE